MRTSHGCAQAEQQLPARRRRPARRARVRRTPGEVQRRAQQRQERHARGAQARGAHTSDFGHFERVITNDYNSAVRSPTAPGLVCITARTIGFSPTHRDFYLRLAGHCKQVPKHKAKMARYGPWQTLWKTLTNGHHVTPPATCAYLKVPGLAGTPLRPGYSAREQWVLSKACRWLAMWCQHRPRKTGRRWAG